MKREKIIYWVSTGIFSLMMLFSAYMYLTSEEVKSSFVHLGFPDYFRVELAIAKILGAATLLIPMMPKGLKQFAYAGFTINLLSASIAHASKGDPAQAVITPMVFLVILVVSYVCYEKLQQLKLSNVS